MPDRLPRTPYPYSLDRATEGVFLDELRAIAGVLAWRADEIQECVLEYRREGTIRPRPGFGWYAHEVPSDLRVYGAVEAFLAGWARASLILFPNDRGDESRGRHLRAVLGFQPGWPPGRDLEDRRLRNGWMHFDEDLDHWSRQRRGRVKKVVRSKGDYDGSMQLAAMGAARVISIDPPRVLLPTRGSWSLHPYLNHAKTLQERLTLLRPAGERWIQYRGVEGLPASWRGEQRRCEIRALGSSVEVTVLGETLVETRRVFEEAVDGELGT